ncbi:PilW family protein [Beggiatoa alba]|nr:PilW family protein [Beggiatoa alba]
MQPLSFNCKRDSKGFSLVELMVAISISLVLLIGLIQIFISSKRSYTIQDSIARMQENGRYAVGLLTKDLRLAGYMGGNADITTISGNHPPIEADGNCGGLNDPRWGRMIARSVFGINDGLTDYTGCITAAGASPQPNDYLSGDVLVIRYARPTQLVLANEVNIGGYYLYSSLSYGEITLLDKNEVITLNTIDPDDTPITYNKLESYAYYVGHKNGDCNGIETAVPALQRLALSTTGTPEKQEIIRGVENLQAQYGEDSNNDGSPNQYLDAQNYQ